MGTEEEWAQRKSRHRGRVGREEQLGTVGREEQLGTVGTEEQLGTEEQWVTVEL